MDITIGNGEGISQAIKRTLEVEEGLNTSQMTGSIWSKVMGQVSAQNQTQRMGYGGGEELTFGKEDDPEAQKSWQQNFQVVADQILKFADSTWKNIVALAKGEQIDTSGGQAATSGDVVAPEAATTESTAVPNITSSDIANKMHSSVARIGTDEEALNTAVSAMTPENIVEVASEYKEKYGENVFSAISNELGLGSDATDTSEGSRARYINPILDNLETRISSLEDGQVKAELLTKLETMQDQVYFTITNYIDASDNSKTFDEIIATLSTLEGDVVEAETSDEAPVTASKNDGAVTDWLSDGSTETSTVVSKRNGRSNITRTEYKDAEGNVIPKEKYDAAKTAQQMSQAQDERDSVAEQNPDEVAKNKADMNKFELKEPSLENGYSCRVKVSVRTQITYYYDQNGTKITKEEYNYQKNKEASSSTEAS